MTKSLRFQAADALKYPRKMILLSAILSHPWQLHAFCISPVIKKTCAQSGMQVSPAEGTTIGISFEEEHQDVLQNLER